MHTVEGELYSLKCSTKKLVWVKGSFEKCTNSARVDEIVYAGHPGWDDQILGIKAVGKLIGSRGGYGQLGKFDYLFEIKCLERAELIFQNRESTISAKEKQRKIEEFEDQSN